MLLERLDSLDPDYVYDIFIQYARYRKREIAGGSITVDGSPIEKNTLLHFFLKDFLGKDVLDFMEKVKAPYTKKETSRLVILQNVKKKYSDESGTDAQNSKVKYKNILNFLLEYGIDITLRSYFNLAADTTSNEVLYAYATRAAGNLLRDSAGYSSTSKDDVTILKYMVETALKLQKSDVDATMDVADPKGGTIKRATPLHSNPRPPILPGIAEEDKEKK